MAVQTLLSISQSGVTTMPPPVAVVRPSSSSTYEPRPPMSTSNQNKPEACRLYRTNGEFVCQQDEVVGSSAEGLNCERLEEFSRFYATPATNTGRTLPVESRCSGGAKGSTAGRYQEQPTRDNDSRFVKVVYLTFV